MQFAESGGVITREGKQTEKEAGFQGRIIDYAHLRGWKVAHFRAGMNRRGKWQVPVEADGAGFPDLFCLRERVVQIECKTDTGQPTPEQHEWLEGLHAAGQEAYLFRPDDWEEVKKILK